MTIPKARKWSSEQAGGLLGISRTKCFDGQVTSVSSMTTPSSAAIPTSTVSEAASKELVRQYGVPLAAEHIVSNSDAAVEAAESIGGAVAVKLNGDAIAHKTERGLVRLGLADAAAVRTASEELLAAARPEDGEVSLLVAPMVSGAVSSSLE